MRFIFTSGLGISESQRIGRWKMVSNLFSRLSRSLEHLGHESLLIVHPQAEDEALPKDRTWLIKDHSTFNTQVVRFKADFVFCWNGGSPGDRITARIARSHGSGMVFAEQGWFPQNTTIYFDFVGTNARCSTRGVTYPRLTDRELNFLNKFKSAYMEHMGIADIFPVRRSKKQRLRNSSPIFVPLQDERDLNITQDSPFHTMNEFLVAIRRFWPKAPLLVKPHPKYPNPQLEEVSNTTFLRPNESPFPAIADSGFVAGINSTLLLESALLGKPVVSFGRSLASGTGLFTELSPDVPPPPLRRLAPDSRRAESTLFRLVRKQMMRSDLDSPEAVTKSEFFHELVRRHRRDSHLPP